MEHNDMIRKSDAIDAIKQLPMWFSDINGVFDNGTYDTPRIVYENGVDIENVYYVGDVINCINNLNSDLSLIKEFAEEVEKVLMKKCIYRGEVIWDNIPAWIELKKKYNIYEEKCEIVEDEN